MGVASIGGGPAALRPRSSALPGAVCRTSTLRAFTRGLPLRGVKTRCRPRATRSRWPRRHRCSSSLLAFVPLAFVPLAFAFAVGRHPGGLSRSASSASAGA